VSLETGHRHDAGLIALDEDMVTNTRVISAEMVRAGALNRFSHSYAAWSFARPGDPFAGSVRDHTGGQLSMMPAACPDRACEHGASAEPPHDDTSSPPADTPSH
jgi:hypothetical protein